MDPAIDNQAKSKGNKNSIRPFSERKMTFIDIFGRKGPLSGASYGTYRKHFSAGQVEKRCTII